MNFMKENIKNKKDSTILQVTFKNHVPTNHGLWLQNNFCVMFSKIRRINYCVQIWIAN